MCTHEDLLLHYESFICFQGPFFGHQTRVGTKLHFDFFVGIVRYFGCPCITGDEQFRSVCSGRSILALFIVLPLKMLSQDGWRSWLSGSVKRIRTHLLGACTFCIFACRREQSCCPAQLWFQALLECLSKWLTKSRINLCLFELISGNWRVRGVPTVLQTTWLVF